MKKILFIIFTLVSGNYFSQGTAETTAENPTDRTPSNKVHFMSKAEELAQQHAVHDKVTSCAATLSPAVVYQNCSTVGTPSFYTNGTNMNFTNAIATPPALSESCINAPGYTTAGTWMRVNPDAGITSLSLQFQSGAIGSGNHNIFVQFFQGSSCASLTAVGCQQLLQVTMGVIIEYTVGQDGFNDAEDIWMYVWDDASKAFNLNFEVIGASEPIYADCSGATNSSSGCNIGAGSESWIGPSGNGKMCSGGTWYSNENTTYYSFIPSTSAGTVSLQGVVCNNGPTGQLQFGVWKDCASVGTYLQGNFLGCAVGTGTIQLSGLTPGDTYVLVVDGIVGEVCSWSNVWTPDCSSVPFPANIMPSPANPVCENQTVNLKLFNQDYTGCYQAFQWYVNSGSGWNMLTDGGSYSGTSTSTLSISNVPLSFNNYQYYCVFEYFPPMWDQSQTNAYTLNVVPAGQPMITSEPSNVNACETTSATFGVTATNAATYQWQQNAGNGFSNLAGQTSANLMLSGVTNAMNGYSYRCIVSSCSGSVTSLVGNLTVNPVPVVNSTSPGYRINTTGTITIGATGNQGSTLNWYAASTGGSSLGTGTSFTTPSLSATTNYYVDATNSCGTSARTAVEAAVYESKLDANSCGMTMANASVPVTALAVPGATNYRFKVENTNLAYLANFYSVVPQLQTNWTNNLQAGQTYTVRVAVMKNGVWSSFGTVCNVTTAPASPVSMLQATYCNSTVSTLNQPVYCVSVPGATNYRYKIENTGLAYSRVYTTGSADSLFRMNVFSDILYATSYTIRVGYYSNGTWSTFGPSCTLTTPAEPKLINTDCGIVLSLMSQDIHAIVEPGATNYKFKVENTGLTFSHVIQSGSSNNTFKMSNVPGIMTNTNYTVKVAYYKNGLWSPFGSACTVTSAANPAIYHSGGAIGIENGTSNVLEEIYLEAFPNPNHGEFTLNASHEGEFTVSNELGQVLKKISLNRENNYQTEISGLGNGVYIISGLVNGELIYRKVLVD